MTVQARIEQRRTSLADNAEMTVKYSIVEGVVDIDGAGETIADITFPVLFTERPVFTSGHELADNSWPVPGAFPVASATIASWDMVQRSPSKKYWQGVHLAIVVTGAANASTLHFSFAGKAFRNPVLGSSGTTDIL